MIIAPSILSCDFNVLGSQIREAETAGAGMLHIDVMDGVFVPSISFGMPVIRSIRKESGMFFDCHLMITDPIRYIDEFAGCGADGITFHLEACDDAAAVIDRIHAAGLKAGISIKPGTPVEALEPYVPSVEMVLLMTVEPGFGGQKFLDGGLERIAAVRQMIERIHPGCLLQIDGGVNKETICACAAAGANVFVAGSAVFKGSITENIEELGKLAAGEEKR